MIIKINYTIREVAKLVEAQWSLTGKDTAIEYLSLDSRKIVEPEKTLFWALTTSSGDGSDFIKPLYKKGVRNFVTQRKIDLSGLEGASILLVEDAIKALQLFAAKHRERFQDICVIGITGSNGKTIVKEWLSEILSGKYRVVKSPRSYNSQIGVALSVLQIDSTHQVGIFEAGISRAGEMDRLEKMIHPRWGVLTNIGSAHDEGFASREEKIREKILLFRRAAAFVFPEMQENVDGIAGLSGKLEHTKALRWCAGDCTLKIDDVKKLTGKTEVRVSYNDVPDTFVIPFTDDASIQNAINCYFVIAVSGLGFEEMNAAFLRLRPVSMRLEVKPGINRSVIINDSYSNDLQSLSVALEFLNHQSKNTTTVIISDLLESGLDDEVLYQRVSDLLVQHRIKEIIGIGERISSHRIFFDAVPVRSFYTTTDGFMKEISKHDFRDEAILIKGARKFSFERIASALEGHLHQTILSVNLTNLAQNIRVYKSLLKPETKMMAMVKAFAYGSGSDQIGALLQYVHVDYLTVAYTEEGVSLREAGIKLPVMVMNVEPVSFENIVRYQLEPELFSFGLFEAFSSFLVARNLTDFPVHLKLDTGMHRLGFEPKDIDQLIQLIRENKRIKIKSIFSHLSSSDNPKHDAFTQGQFERFQQMAGRLKEIIPYDVLCHIANSAAISRFPGMQMDMVRLGIGLYGLDGNSRLSKRLMPVHRLTTTISQIKSIKSGEVVGYGMNVIERDCTIATVGIGYADGYHRLLGNGVGKMLVHQTLAPTIGNVCMDMTMIDITGLPDVNEGDEVVVFGEELPVDDVARWAGTIPYEILTGISPRVRRVYFEET